MNIGSDVLTRLRMCRDKADVEGLQAFLSDSFSPQIQKKALDYLAAIGQPSALEVVGNVISDASRELAEHGMRVLTEVPGDEAVRAMARGLTSTDPIFRSYVLFFLSHRPESEALRSILRATKDANPKVSQVATKLIKEAALAIEGTKIFDARLHREISDFLRFAGGGQGNLLARLKRCKEAADIEGLGQFLSDSISPQIQKSALEHLASIGVPEALEQISTALEYGEREVAEHGMRVLLDVPGAGAVRAMARGLRSSDPVFRSYVLFSLSHRPEPEALKWILRATSDESPRINKIAVRLIRESARNVARLAGVELEILDKIFRFFDRETTLTMLEDGVPDPVRLAAIRSVGSMGGDNIASVLVQLCQNFEGKLKEAALSSLETMGPFSVHLMLPLLGEPSKETRRRAVLIYARRCDREGAKALDHFTKDPEADVRLAAFRSMIELSAPDLLETACRLAKDPDRAVRLEAVSYLTGVNKIRVVPLLIEAALDTEEEIAKKAIFSLAARRTWSHNLLDRILNLVKQGVSQPRISQEDADGYADIIRLLQRVKPEGALDVLVVAARSNSVRLRRVAGEAIEDYPEPERLRALAELVDVDDKGILRRVAIGLGEAGDSRAMVPLIRAAEECKGAVAKRALQLLERQANLNDLSFLIEALRMKWPSVKIFAATEIAKLNSPEFIEPLLIALEDEDVEVQIAVAQALKNFADDERVAECLVEKIGYGDISLRLVVIEIIGEASQEGKKIEAALEPLIRALGNQFVRRRAEQALKSMGDRRGLLAIKRRKIRDEIIPKPERPDRSERLGWDDEAITPRFAPRLQYA